MATIQERRTAEGRVHYRALVRVQGCPVHTATFERKTDAKRWAAQLEGALLDGRRFPAGEEKRRTVADLIDRYCQEVVESARGPAVGTARAGAPAMRCGRGPPREPHRPAHESNRIVSSSAYSSALSQGM